MGMIKSILFLSILFTGLTLGPGMAHLLEMYHKMSLSLEDYKVVQRIYRGWAMLGVFQFGAVAFTGILTFKLRQIGKGYQLPLISFLCVGATLVIFFILTYPVNQATNNWLTFPENWVQLRQQWEYSHALNAILEIIAFILLIRFSTFHSCQP